MESIKHYHKNAISCLPDELQKWVEFRLSPPINKNFCILRGVGYEHLPEGEFDMVFIDGPTEVIEGEKTMCMDILDIVERQERPLDIIVDTKQTTLIGLIAAFGPGKVRYSTLLGVGMIENVCKSDLILARDPKQLKTQQTIFSHFGWNTH